MSKNAMPLPLLASRGRTITTSADSSIFPAAFRGALSRSAMTALRLLAGSIRKYSLPVSCSYGPTCPKARPPARSRREVISTRETSRVDEAGNQCGQQQRQSGTSKRSSHDLPPCTHVPVMRSVSRLPSPRHINAEEAEDAETISRRARKGQRHAELRAVDGSACAQADVRRPVDSPYLRDGGINQERPKFFVCFVCFVAKTSLSAS